MAAVIRRQVEVHPMTKKRVRGMVDSDLDALIRDAKTMCLGNGKAVTLYAKNSWLTSTSQETSLDIAQEATKDLPAKEPQETPLETQQEAQKDTPQEASKDTTQKPTKKTADASTQAFNSPLELLVEMRAMRAILSELLDQRQKDAKTIKTLRNDQVEMQKSLNSLVLCRIDSKANYYA